MTAPKLARLVWTDGGRGIGAEYPNGRTVPVVGDLLGHFVGITAPVVRCKGGVRVARRKDG